MIMQAIHLLGVYLHFYDSYSFGSNIERFVRWMSNAGGAKADDAMLCANCLREWCQARPLLRKTLDAEFAVFLTENIPNISRVNQQKFDELFEGSMFDKPVTALPGIDDTAGNILAAKNIFSVSEHNILILDSIDFVFCRCIY